MAKPRYSIQASADRAWLVQTITDLEDAGWKVETWLQPWMDTGGDVPTLVYGVVLRLPENPAFVRETAAPSPEPRAREHDFQATYQPEGKVAFPREGLLQGVRSLIREAKERGLPLPADCPEESLETVGNSVLYRTGLALKKRISAHDTLSAGEPENLAAAQMQGA